MPSNLPSAQNRRLAASRALAHIFFLSRAIVAATGLLPAVLDLGHNTLQADPAGMLEHLLAVDLEALAKLNVGVSDEFFEQRADHGYAPQHDTFCTAVGH